MKLHVLDEDFRKPLQRLLLSNVDANLYLLKLLQTTPLNRTSPVEWIGAVENGELVAVSCALGRRRRQSKARLLMVHGREDGAAYLGRFCAIRGGTELLVGERTCTDAYWNGMNSPKPRLFYDQRIYCCTKPSMGTKVELALAESRHFSQLYRLSAEMMMEDLDHDPREDSNHHERTINARIQLKRSWIYEVDQQIHFLIDIGTETPLGAQVGGTYVPTEFRGQGTATSGMRAICAQLLQSSERVSLHVNEANTPAVRCYERAGFERRTPYRLISLR